MSRVAILFIFVLAGCAKDPKSVLCQASELTIVDGGTTVTQTYTYENGKLMLMASNSGTDSFQTSFEYTPEGDLGKTILAAHGETFITTFTHNSLHYLVASIFGHNGDTTHTNYLYNDILQLVRQDKYIQDSGGGLIADERVYYTYPDLVTHNPSTIATVNLADSVVVHYEYDNKINPERELFLPTIQPYNNITRITTDTSSVTISYQYDANGYPISSTSSNGVTRTWTYSCKEF